MAKNKGQVGPEKGPSNSVDVQKYLAGMDYPASKEDIVQMAMDSDAPDEVKDMLDGIPDKEYDSPADLSKELGK